MVFYETLTNSCNFPSLLGKNLQISTGQNNKIKEKKEKVFFYDNCIIENSVEFSSFDILLLCQILEIQQKRNIGEKIENKKYKLSFDENDKILYKDEILNKCFKNSLSEEFKHFKNIKDEKEGLDYICSLIQQKTDIENKNKYDMYAISKNNYSLTIKSKELLKQRGIRNKLENRIVIKNSLLKLLNSNLKIYFFEEELLEEINHLKKWNSYKDWNNEVQKIFIKNKNNLKCFSRNVLEEIKYDDNLETITVEINESFLKYCEKGKLFDFSNLFNLSLFSSKSFYIKYSFLYEEILSEEIVFEIMDLNHKEIYRNRENANRAISELIEQGFLDKKSSYNKKRKQFSIFKIKKENYLNIFKKINKEIRKLFNFNFNLEVDHVIPSSENGSNHYLNLQILTKDDNLEKGSKLGYLRFSNFELQKQYIIDNIEKITVIDINKKEKLNNILEKIKNYY